MSPLPIELHAAAIAEARNERQWYEERSPDAATRFMAELDLAIDRIAATPRNWAIHSHGTRRYALQRFPHVVVYRELEAIIQIVAVPHVKRRPGYWRERVV